MRFPDDRVTESLLLTGVKKTPIRQPSPTRSNGYRGLFHYVTRCAVDLSVEQSGPRGRRDRKGERIRRVVRMPSSPVDARV